MVEHVERTPSTGEFRRVRYGVASRCARRSLLDLEAAAAARRRRALPPRPAAAAARPCPGSCSGSSTRARSTGSPRASPQGSVLVSATNGKTTTTAMVAEILARGCASPTTDSGANLVSGRRLHPPPTPRTPSSGCSRSTRRALPEVARRVRPRALAARQPLPRPARPLRRARARRRALARRRRRAARRRTLVVNGDDPQVGDLARGRPRVGRLRARRPAPRAARRSSTRPTRSTACAAARRTTTPPPTSGISATTAARTAATPRPAARRRRARDRAARARRARVHARRARRERARRAARCPGSTTSTTRSAPAALALALGAPLDEVVAGLERFSAAFGRFERIAVGDRAPADAPDQEPGRGERGGADARRRRARHASRSSR